MESARFGCVKFFKPLILIAFEKWEKANFEVGLILNSILLIQHRLFFWFTAKKVYF